MAGSETGIEGLHETKELAGFQVVEIGHSLAGRLVVKLLTDQGADATCVDWPEGAPDGLPPVAWDDGRETEPLHLSESADRESFLVKLSGADLLVSSLNPKRLEEVGLGTAAFHQRNPMLIVLQLSPFPDEAGRAEEVLDDELISAELGYNRTGGNRQVAGDADSPLAEPLAIPSTYAALFGAAYVGAALLQRDRGRSEIAIDVSLFGAGMMGINGSLVKIENPNFDDPNVTPYRLPMVARYRCGDGRYIQFQGSTPNTLHQALAGLDELDWWPEAIASLRQLPSKAAEDSWRARFAAKFNERSAAEWERAISEAGGASAMCRSRSEWVAEPHASSTGIIARRSGTDSGSPVVLGPAMRTLRGDDAAPSGFSPVNNARAVIPDRPLEGVRVLDLTIILAGPSTSRILAEFGAEVIKVDPAERATWPGVLPTNWLDVNRSKRSTIIDLKTPEGKEILWKLIDTADVFVESYRLGRLESLGFGYDAVRKRNPRIVYASVNAYDFGGPFSQRPGWEPNAQAMTGMQTARSVPGEVRPIVASINDYGTALLGVTGIVASLRAARSTGLGRRVLVSLARTASFFQTKELSWHERLVERNDLEALAFHRCKGGWIATLRGAEDPGVAKRVADLAPDAGAELLRKEGLAAVVVRKPHELLDLDWVRSAGLLASWDHPVWGTVTNAVAGGRSNAFVQHADRASPQPGEDTRAVLGELGYGEVEVDALYAAGIARGPLALWGGD